MKLVTQLVGAILFFASFSAFADSTLLDREYMSQCRASVELSRAANGDLAVKFENLDTARCNKLRFYDVSSGRTLKTYDINGTSYTLSKSQRSSLSEDCQVGVTVSGPYARDTKTIALGWWCSGSGTHMEPSRPSYNNQSFQLSNKGNCKLLKNGVYSNQNVSDSFCTGLRGNDVATYEFSNNNNCKRMINGQYSNQNVSSAFCTARF